MRRILLPAVVYFGLVFGVGFILGIGRVLLLVPAIGERAAELIEAPLMIVAILSSARLVCRRFEVSSKLGLRLSLGLLALLPLLVVELMVVLWLRGLTIAQYLESRDPVAGSVYVALLFFYALLPAILGIVDRSPAARWMAALYSGFRRIA